MSFCDAEVPDKVLHGFNALSFNFIFVLVFVEFTHIPDIEFHGGVLRRFGAVL
jgi:hypothetical protein